jgi:hypothetical protein
MIQAVSRMQLMGLGKKKKGEKNQSLLLQPAYKDALTVLLKALPVLDSVISSSDTNDRCAKAMDKYQDSVLKQCKNTKPNILSCILGNNKLRSTSGKRELLFAGLRSDVNCIKLLTSHLKINTRRESSNYSIM